MNRLNAHETLLSQALTRYAAAVARGDLAAAEKHRKIYLSVYPISFANAMQSKIEVKPIAKIIN